MSVKRLCELAALLAIAIVIGIAESFIPSFVPGAKLGLANIVTLIALYRYSKREALLVLILRMILVSLFLGKFLSVTFYMSVVGGLFAYLAMLLGLNLKKLTVIGVSLLGAVFHVIGQICIGMVILETIGIIFYLPVLMILSIFTGIFNGFVASRYFKIMKNDN